MFHFRFSSCDVIENVVKSQDRYLTQFLFIEQLTKTSVPIKSIAKADAEEGMIEVPSGD